MENTSCVTYVCPKFGHFNEEEAFAEHEITSNGKFDKEDWASYQEVSPEEFGITF